MRDLQVFAKQIDRSEGAPPAIDRAAALTVFWNAGTKVIPDYPANLGDQNALIQSLKFDSQSPYPGWSLHARANKIVEIYDYYTWISGLWQSGAADYSPPGSHSAQLICVDYLSASAAGPQRNTLTAAGFWKSVWIRIKYVKIRIKRLSLGNYRDDFAWIDRQH